MVKDDLLVLLLAGLRFFWTGLIVVVLATLVYHIVKSEFKDGLGEWRKNSDYDCAVMFRGERYYCDQAETLAGHPEKLILYRGEDYLLLPDKYSVKSLVEK